MTIDTTAPTYWLNWRFLLSGLWILLAILASAFIIWKNEIKAKNGVSGNQQEPYWLLQKGDAWRACLKKIHPTWLLSYRVLAFGCSVALITADFVRHGVHTLYFYTEWTFTLVVIYFGLASALSIYGCLFYKKKADLETCSHFDVDVEQNSHLAAKNGQQGGTMNMPSNLESTDRAEIIPIYGSGWECALQIIFQITAGAVALTDSVFWLVLFPFYSRNRSLHFLAVCMHSVNAVLIIGDAILNKMHFPFFRIAYFVMWTSAFVVFQWIFHAFISTSWPYQFLDLSSPYAPLWYLAVGLLHFPCFGVFWYIFKVKRACLRKVAIGEQ